MKKKEFIILKRLIRQQNYIGQPCSTQRDFHPPAAFKHKTFVQVFLESNGWSHFVKGKFYKQQLQFYEHYL